MASNEGIDRLIELMDRATGIGTTVCPECNGDFDDEEAQAWLSWLIEQAKLLRDGKPLCPRDRRVCNHAHEVTYWVECDLMSGFRCRFLRADLAAVGK